MPELSKRVQTFTASDIHRSRCGKCFRRDELMAIGELAVRYDAFVVTDEVYEHIIF